MQNKYIALWHDHDEFTAHIIKLCDSAEEAHKALQDKWEEMINFDKIPEFNGFDEQDEWAHISKAHEVTFQISMLN